MQKILVQVVDVSRTGRPFYRTVKATLDPRVANNWELGLQQLGRLTRQVIREVRS